MIPFFAQGGNSPTGVYGLEEMLQNFLAIPYEKGGNFNEKA